MKEFLFRKGALQSICVSCRLKQTGSTLHYIGKDGAPAGEVPADPYKTPAAHAAILDLPMLNDSEQCADTVIHLYAEYLYAQARYDELSFHFYNGFECDFLHYTQGYRPNAAKTAGFLMKTIGQGRSGKYLSCILKWFLPMPIRPLCSGRI